MAKELDVAGETQDTAHRYKDVLLVSLIVLTPTFRLARQGQKLFLITGGETIQIDGPHPKQAKVGAHLVSYGENLPASIDGQPLDLRELFHTWLEDDAKWGGHGPANQLRYMDTGAGGISTYLTQVVPQGNGTALGILSMRFDGPSGTPLGGQILARISARSLDFLNFVPEEDGPAFGTSPLRIFSSRAGQLFWNKGALAKLDATGKIGPEIMKTPAGNPIGILDGRYVVIKHEERDDVDGFDLQRMKPFSMFHETETQFGKLTFLQSVPERGCYLVMERQINANGTLAPFTLHVPDGRRTPLPSSINLTWKELAIGNDGTTVIVVQAGKGNILSTLHVPEPGHSQ